MDGSSDEDSDGACSSNEEHKVETASVWGGGLLWKLRTPDIRFHRLAQRSLTPLSLFQEIMVGSRYQAQIPPLGSHVYQDRGRTAQPLTVQRPPDVPAPLTPSVPPDVCGADQLLWRPGVLPGTEVEDFLLYVQKHCDQQGAAGGPAPGDAVRDNEQVGRPRAKGDPREDVYADANDFARQASSCGSWRPEAP